MCLLSVLDVEKGNEKERRNKEYWDGFDPSGINRKTKSQIQES